ncbi:MAG: S9 family peptidase [Terriglobales bacterium]
MRRSVVIYFFLLYAIATFAQQASLTNEWIYSEQGSQVAAVPKVTWLDDGSAIIYNTRLPKVQRNFEKLVPSTGQRQPMLNMANAVASLKALGIEDAKDTLEWPEDFDASGQKAIYVFKGDVFVLDLPTAKFTRATNTPEEEKDAQFSPDSKQIAFVRNNDLYVYDITSGRETRLTTDGSENLLNGTVTWVYWEEIMGRRDIGYWWAPDSHSIAYLQTDVTGVPVSTFVDFEPQDPKIIKQVYPKAGELNPKVRVGVVEIGEQPKTEWVNIADKYEWLLRVKWMPDGGRLAVYTLDRSQTEQGLYFADAKTGQTKKILTEKDPAWVNVNDDLYFLKDGQHFLWASERDGYMHLYRYKMDGTLVNQVTNGDWAIAASGGLVFWVHQAVTGIDEKNDWIYFTALKDSSIERHLYRVHSDGSGLTRLDEGTGRHSIAMSPDTRYYFDTYSNIRTLPALSLHTSDGKQVAMIAAPRPELLPPAMVYPELTTIPTSDGFAMPAQILKPRNFDPHKKYPVILYIYGGPSAPSVSNSWQRDMVWDNVLAANGFVVAVIDNRAATAMSKKLENTLFENPAASDTKDLVDGIRWLKKQSWVDPKRFGIYGWSGGGTNTLNVMTRSQEIKAGIAGAPVTDWHYYDSKWAEALVKLPQTNTKVYDETSLVKRAGDLHGTLLLIWGTYDDNVHPQNEQAFINELIAKGKPYHTMIYPMRKHGFVDKPAQVHLHNAMLEFWKENL